MWARGDNELINHTVYVLSIPLCASVSLLPHLAVQLSQTCQLSCILHVTHTFPHCRAHTPLIHNVTNRWVWFLSLSKPCARMEASVLLAKLTAGIESLASLRCLHLLNYCCSLPQKRWILLAFSSVKCVCFTKWGWLIGVVNGYLVRQGCWQHTRNLTNSGYAWVGRAPEAYNVQ